MLIYSAPKFPAVFFLEWWLIPHIRHPVLAQFSARVTTRMEQSLIEGSKKNGKFGASTAEWCGAISETPLSVKMVAQSTVYRILEWYMLLM